MIRENFEIYYSQMAKNDVKLSTMVRENFLKFTCPKWLKIISNVPWLEKILKFTTLRWLKMVLNYPQWLGENFKIYLFETGTNDVKLSTMVGENFEI